MREGDYFEAGLKLLDAGDFEAAVVQFESAIKLGLGDMAAAHVCRAEALAGLERWQDALKSVNSALEIEPYMAAAYLQRGDIWQAQRQHEQAVNDYTMAIHIEPNHDEAHLSRALAYESQRRYGEAEADLTRALKLNPELLAAYEARGRARAAQFKFDGAVADLSYYLRSGGGRRYDNHSETQGYLLLLRLARVVWRVLGRGRKQA